jgi:hypothetical protein
VSSFEEGAHLPVAAAIVVVAAEVYDCESVTSSARDKTHEGMLPVIRPDRSSEMFFPCFAGCTPKWRIDFVVGFRFTVFVFQS